MTDTPEPVAPQSNIKNQPAESGLPFPLPVMVESLLFVASEPVPIMQIAEALDVNLAKVEQALTELNAEIITRGIRVQRKGDKVQLTTQPECAPYVEKFLGLDLTTRLSKPALETLAIIAYQQPVTRAQIEHVRGVNCDGVLSTLLNRGLIEEVGRLETAGRPIQYGTTFAFLQHFGLRGLDDMPSLQPEEAVALTALAEQGQAIASDQGGDLTVAPAPALDQPAALIETQLSLMNDEAPQDLGPVIDLVSPQAGTAIELQPISANAEAAVETAANAESTIEPQSSADSLPEENAAS